MSTSLTVGKSVVNSSNPYVTLTVTESATSATANTSTLTYSLVIYRPSSVSSSASKSYSFSINGTSYSGTTTIGGSGSKTITSGTQTVSHSSDGTKTISLSLSFTFGLTWSGTSMGTYSTSGTMTLTSLDRTAPTITISSSSSTNSTITIAATSNVSCNTWQYSTNGGSSYTTFNSGSATSVSKTITGLSANTTYAVRIRAYKVSNNVSAYAAKSITTLGASSITSASALTLSDDGTSCSVTFTPYSTAYYFTLTFTIGSYSVTTDRFCPASTSAYTFTDYAFTTEEWAPYITSAATASCTATLTTYADASTTTAMGTGTKTFTVTVPSDLVPVINSVTFTEAAEDFPTAFTGTFVQSFTQLLIEADAESVYSATIASITATVESTDYDVTDGGTTGTLTTSGTHTISVTATDSRGCTATEEYEVEVAAYFTPTLYLTYTTTSDTLALTASGGVASVEGLNARTVTFTAVAAADESQSYTAEFDLENDGTDTYSQTYTISDDSAQTLTWNLTATITDSVNSLTVTKTTGVTALSFLSGGKGAAFFKEAESEGLEVGGKLMVDGALTTEDCANITNYAVITASGEEDGNGDGASAYLRIYNEGSGIHLNVISSKSGACGISDTNGGYQIYRDADGELHLGTDTVGDSTQPIYLENGVPTACTHGNTSRGFEGIVPYVGSDGVMDIGQYIDLHAADSTNDYDVRLTCTSYGNLRIYGNYAPTTNGGYTLGTSSYKWGTIYSTSSTISTSDSREKQDIADMDADKAYDFIMALRPVTYKLTDGQSGRTHYGLTAQDVEQTMREQGISSTEFAGFVKTPIDADGEELSYENEDQAVDYIYGLRYEEFISPLMKTVQKMQEEIDSLKAEIEALKG